MYNKLYKGGYIMGTEKNNYCNNGIIFEISSKEENVQNINRYTDKKEKQSRGDNYRLDKGNHR